MNAELVNDDATAIATLIRTKEVSAEEVMDATLARIDTLEPEVHALAGTDFERARDKARTPSAGPFGGVPFLIKDLLAYPGLRHSMGSRLMAGNVAQEGSPYVDALDAAGLITIGKTTTSEFGLLGSTESLLEGTTHNPWNVERSATGSSGGSAAAVAARMVPMANANDGGGSIRIPASACGLFGFKPSRGRCRPTGMEAGDPLGILSEHVLTRSVRDSARLLAITEADGSRPAVGFVDAPLTRRLRIGVYDETLLGLKAEPAVRRVLEATMKLCASLGHEIVETPPPPVDGQAISDAFFTAAGASMSGAKSMFEGMLGRPVGTEDFEPFTLELIEWFQAQPQGALERAQSAAQTAADRYLEHLDGFDALLCPTLPLVVPMLGTLAPSKNRRALVTETERLAGFTPIHSMAGVPAMSVPLGADDDGLPVGSHFAAPVGQEALLLGLAYELEMAAPWADRRPDEHRP